MKTATSICSELFFDWKSLDNLSPAVKADILKKMDGAISQFVHIGYRDGDGPVFQVRPGQSTEGFKKVFELVEDQP